MTFSTTALTGSRTLVQGQDKFGNESQIVLDTRQWDAIKEADAQRLAEKGFADAVEGFFAPLTEAAEAFEAGVSKTDDPITFIVHDEEVPGVRGVPARVTHLSKESQILRLIENNLADSRLVWVGDDLEILASDNTVQQTLPGATALVESELGGVEV